MITAQLSGLLFEAVLFLLAVLFLYHWNNNGLSMKVILQVLRASSGKLGKKISQNRLKNVETIQK